MSSASKAVLHFLNSLKEKDLNAHRKSFHPDSKANFVDILPGGKKIFSSSDLIKIHPTFFNHPLTSFEPLNSAKEFSSDHFSYIFERDFLFQVGVDVKVTKPVILSEKEDMQTKLETFNNHISLTFIFDEILQEWFPQMITNTLISS